MSGNELGHKCVADGPEAQLGPKIIRGLNEFALVAVCVKDAGFWIGAGGQAVGMVLTVGMLQPWHGNSLCHLAEGRRHQRPMSDGHPRVSPLQGLPRKKGDRFWSPGRRPGMRQVAPSGLRALVPHGGERLRLTPVGRCPGPASAGWCAPLGLQLLSAPGPAHSGRETSIIEKRRPEFRHCDRIQDGGGDGWGKDADRKTGGPRYLLSGCADFGPEEAQQTGQITDADYFDLGRPARPFGFRGLFLFSQVILHLALRFD